MTYMNHTISQTNITTTVSRRVGRTSYDVSVSLYEIDGDHAKPAGRHPFLTSQAACREYIREMTAKS